MVFVIFKKLITNTLYVLHLCVCVSVCLYITHYILPFNGVLIYNGK